MKVLVLSLILAIVLITEAGAQRDPQAMQVVDAFVQASGGRDLWQSTLSCYQEIRQFRYEKSTALGKVDSVAEEHELRRFYKEPTYYLEVHLSSSPNGDDKFFGTDDQVRWSGTYGIVFSESHGDFEAMEIENDVHSEVYYMLQDRMLQDSLVYLSDSSFLSAEYHVLRAVRKYGLVQLYFFNKQTHLLDHIINPQVSRRFSYADYRIVRSEGGDRIVPFEARSYLKDRLTLLTQVRFEVFDVEMDEMLFNSSVVHQMEYPLRVFPKSIGREAGLSPSFQRNTFRLPDKNDK